MISSANNAWENCMKTLRHPTIYMLLALLFLGCGGGGATSTESPEPVSPGPSLAANPPATTPTGSLNLSSQMVVTESMTIDGDLTLSGDALLEINYSDVPAQVFQVEWKHHH